MITPNVDCIAVCLYSWLSTTFGIASRFSSITMRVFLSDSSRSADTPSIFLSRTYSAIAITRFARLTMYGISVTTICTRPVDSFSSICARARITILPRPVSW